MGAGSFKNVDSFYSVNVMVWGGSSGSAVPSAPSISFLSKNVVDYSGGSLVFITGSSFTNAVAVAFGGTPAASFTVKSDTLIWAVTPARSPNATPVNVTVTDAFSQTGTATNALEFFSPNNITSSYSWVRGDLGLTASAGRWESQNGGIAGNVIYSNSTGFTANPALPTVVTASNDKPAVSFGVAGMMGATTGSKGTGGFGVPTAGHEFLVARADFNTANNVFRDFGGSVADPFIPWSAAPTTILDDWGNNLRQEPGAGHDSGLGDLSPVYQLPFVMEVQNNGNASWQLNQSLLQSYTGQVVKWATTPTYGRSVSALNTLGYIAEDIIFNSVLSAPDITRVYAYLADRYTDVFSVSPQLVTSSGGDIVTAKGKGLLHTTAVSVGGVTATSFAIIDDQTLKITLPALTASTAPYSLTVTANNNTHTKSGSIKYQDMGFSRANIKGWWAADMNGPGRSVGSSLGVVLSKDQSGLGNDLYNTYTNRVIVATAPTAPALQPASQNGLDYWKAVNNTDSFATASFALGGTGNLSCFAVFQYHSGSGESFNYSPIITSKAGTRDWDLLMLGSTASPIQFSYGRLNAEVASININPNVSYMASLILRSNNTDEMWVSSSIDTPTGHIAQNLGGQFSTSASIELFSRNGTAGNVQDIMEVILFNNDVGTDRAAIETYLANKWLTSPNSPSMPALALWLRGDKGVTTSGGNVTVWADQSGNGRDYTIVVGRTGPTVTTNINGRATISGNSAQGPMSGSTFNNVLSACHAFIVTKKGSTGENSAWKFQQGPGPEWYPFTDDTTDDFYIGFGSTLRLGPIALNLKTASHVVEIVSTSSEYTIYVDGVQIATRASNTVGWDVGGSLIIGSSNNANDSNPSAQFTGDTAELILYGQKLTTAQRNSIYSYLRGRYATP